MITLIRSEGEFLRDINSKMAKWNNDKSQSECKKPLKPYVCKEDCVLNPSKSSKKCRVGKY